MTSRHLSLNDLSTLSNICHVAGLRFRENAELLRGQRDGDGTFFAPGAAKKLAEEFDQQAEVADEFSRMFILAEPVDITHEEDDEEEGA